MSPATWEDMINDAARRRAELDLIDPSVIPRTVDLGTNEFAWPGEATRRADEVCMVFRRPSGKVLTLSVNGLISTVSLAPPGNCCLGNYPKKGIRVSRRRRSDLTPVKEATYR